MADQFDSGARGMVAEEETQMVSVGTVRDSPQVP